MPDPITPEALAALRARVDDAQQRGPWTWQAEGNDPLIPPLLARITALEEALDDAISFIDCECDDEDRIARLRRVRSGARP